MKERKLLLAASLLIVAGMILARPAVGSFDGKSTPQARLIAGKG